MAVAPLSDNELQWAQRVWGGFSALECEAILYAAYRWSRIDTAPPSQDFITHQATQPWGDLGHVTQQDCTRLLLMWKQRFLRA